MSKHLVIPRLELIGVPWLQQLKPDVSCAVITMATVYSQGLILAYIHRYLWDI